MDHPYGSTRRILKFLRHQANGLNGHQIHSSFVFGLYHALHQPLPEPTKTFIRAYRKELRDNRTVLTFNDPGKEMRPASRLIKDIAQNSGCSHRAGKYLHHLAQYLKPNATLELGTSLGLSCLYLHFGHPHAEITTVEGVEVIHQVSKAKLGQIAPNIVLEHGLFEEAIDKYVREGRKFDLVFLDGHHQEEASLSYFKRIKELIHPTATIIFDDIHWSAGMERAWKVIQKDSDVTISVDLFFYGLARFQPNTAKQHFTLRL